MVSILKECKYNSFDMFNEALSVAMNNDLSTIHNIDSSDRRRMFLEFIKKLGNQNDDVPVYYAVNFVGGKNDLYKKLIINTYIIVVI